MRNCLRLSQAAWTKCSSLIKTTIVRVQANRKTDRARGRKVKFSESEKHLFIYPLTSLHCTKYFKVFNKAKFAELTLCACV